MGQFLGRYELVAKIGSGGMAEVFLARLGGVEGFSRELVIKRMRPELSDRAEAVSMFLDEARLCAKLTHPNVVQVFDLGETDGTYFIAMEFVDGPHLGKLARHLVRKGTPLPLLLSAYIVNRAAEGLHYAHTQPDPDTGRPLGIVHRDISPHNLLVSRFGDVKVADFGVAKAIGKASETKSGVVKGKIAYMSPEQVYGDDLDGRSDVFALGIVLFEITTSRRLFKHKSDLVSMQRITQEDAPAPSRFNPDVDAQLEHIILKALQRNRERRYRSAQAMKEDLDAWISARASGHLKSELATFIQTHATDLEMPREAVPDTGSVRSQPRSEGSPFVSQEGDALALTQAERTARPSSELHVSVVSQLVDGTRTVPARKSDIHALDTIINREAGLLAGGVDDEIAPPAIRSRDRDDELGREPSTSGVSLSTKAFGALKTNLTSHGSRFIGRKDHLKRLHEQFEAGAQIVTVVGPGGTGKTRLAQRYAERHLPDLSDGGGGAWFADLTNASDVESICGVVASALNVPLTAATTTEEIVTHVARALAGRGRTLVILDNFEHVADFAMQTVDVWASLAPQSRFLVTSREVLKIPGEEVFELEPLELPQGTAVEESEAVQLFVERARAVRPGYTLTTLDREVVGQIVRKLDGIPLAIELAAARMSVLKPQKILERLGRRFDLLKGGGRNLSPRQATLRGAVDWSWELLTPVEQDALAQCAVFRGGFSLESAEEVLDLSEHEDSAWALDVVQALKDKSLLRAYDDPELEGETRFRMYESVREYALEKLEHSGRRAKARARHAAYYLAQAEEWRRASGTRGSYAALRRLKVEYSNLLAVHERARGMGASGKKSAPPEWAKPDMALRVAVALEPLFAARGPFRDQIRLVDEALEVVDDSVDPELRIRAFAARGRARRRLGQIQESRHDYAEALKLAKAAGAKRDEGPVLRDLGVLAADEGRLEDALRNYKDALRVHRATSDRGEEGITLAYLAFLYDELGRLEEAKEHYQQGIRVLREVGDKRFEGLTLGNFGGLYQELGDYAAAKRTLEEALELLRSVGDRTFEGPFEGYLGNLCHEMGELDEAVAHFNHALGVMRETGNLRYEGLMMGYLSAVYACLDRVDEAERTLAEADRRNQEIGDPRHIDVGKLLRGFLELALARQARKAGNEQGAKTLVDRARRRIAEAEAPGKDGGPSMAETSDDARRSLRLLKKEMPPEAGG